MTTLLRLVGLRELLARPARSTLAVIGIALGVALVLAIQLANRATFGALRQTIDGTAGRAELQVVAASDGGLDESLASVIRGVAGVATAVPVVEGTAFVDDGRGESLTIFGVDLGDEQSLRTYEGTGGDANEAIEDPLVFLAQPDSVAVTRAFTTARGLDLGDHVAVLAGSGRHQLTIRGVMAETGVARVLGSGLAVMDLFAAERLLGRDRRIDRIDLVLAPGHPPAEVAAALGAVLPTGTAVERPEQRGRQVEAMLTAFQMILSSASLIALAVAVFIVYNSLATVVLERRREIGLLRALGVRRRQVLALHLGEALVEGMVGVALGTGLGLGLARLLAAPVAASASGALGLPLLVGHVAVDVPALALAAAAGLVAALLAALVPALGAARLPIVEAMRATAAVAAPRWAGRLLGAAIGCATVALGAVLAALRTKAPGFAYLADAAMFATIGLGSAPVMLLVARAVSPLAGRFLGAGGRLLGESSRRLPARTGATVAALTLGIAFSASTSIVAQSFEVSVIDWAQSFMGHDFFVRSALRERGFVNAPLPPRVMDELRALPEVRTVTPFRLIRQRYAGETIALTGASNGPAGKTAWVSDNFARRYRKRAGDLLRLDTPRGRRAFRIVRVDRNYNSDRGTVTVALGTLRRLWRDGLVTDINIDLVPGADRAAVRAAILQRSGAEYRLEVLEPKALEAQLTAGIERTFAFTWGVQAITLVVAFAGVFDTVLAGVLARRREIGVLRALGCLRRQVATAFALEGLLIGGLAAALGVAGGLALAFTQVRVLFPDLLGYVADVHVPAVRLAGIAAASLVLTAAAAALPARRAAHLVVTEALAVS